MPWQVDQMSGGRVELGLGAGWFEAEHAAYGIPFPDPRARFDRLEESVAVITGLWTTPYGESFDFGGKHFRLDRSPALPQPVQSPRPPVLSGGTGRKRTPALAARYADIGSQRIYLQVLDLGDLDHLELVAEKVMPQL